MLVSLSRRYIFLANRKAASTSFEAVLDPECELATGLTPDKFAFHPLTGGGGKHASYRECARIYARMFDRTLPIDHFLVFGVVRDPIERQRSRLHFRLRRPEAFPQLVELGFEQFLRRVMENNAAPADNPGLFQYDFFRDDHGAIGANYLIRFDNIPRSLEILRDATGHDFTRAAGTTLNASRGENDAIDPGLRREAERFFARDYELYESATDRLLAEPIRGGELSVEKTLRRMGRIMGEFDLASSIAHKLRHRLRRDPSFSVASLLRSIDGDA